MTNFDTAFEEIQKLVDDFEKNISHYLRSDYSEAQVRLDFIDKFLIALGWDVRNDNRFNPLQREVIIEKTQRQQQSKAQKRADYAFYVAPDFKNVKFFLEAKKPSKNLKNADDYFQTARYGWNAGVGISILTDFEEFHIIDCRFKPDINKVFNAQNKTLHYTDYRDKDKFATLYWLFSKEAVLAGNIEAYVKNLPKPKKGTSQTTLFGGKWQSIDESFLEYIDGIRETLARAFKKNDNSLTSELLTEAVTRTIDRLVFIRFLEDKLIEPENHVSEFGNRTTAWKDFINTCRIFDAKYNGVIFKKHFIDEQNFSGADDTHFKNICNELSHLNSPYDFNAIPIHILGSIYERFLGKVVVATDKRVKIEEKPEVRKAGGVYYTPKYIVDYIVKNTVGKLIAGKKPADIAKMKFADIACGSGSFLIGVLECLIDYHTSYYNENKEEAKKDKCLQVDGLFVLSIKQKQKILTNNIYGVDLDHQATEVTQLSLYLKMLEDETTATANEMQVLFHEKILPNLSNNIKCGNSLIGSDILTGHLFDFEEEKKLNPFDFENEFSEVFKNGGFDAVVGNPPYIPIESFNELEKKYYQNSFPFFTRKFDSSVIFIARALNILKPIGLLGYISSQTWETGENYSGFRKNIFTYFGIVEIINLPFNVFKDAYVDTGIFIFSKTKRTSYKIFSYLKKEKIEIINDVHFENINCENIKEPDYKIIFKNSVNNILSKFDHMEYHLLGNITISTQGLAGSRFPQAKNIDNNDVLPFINATVKRYSFSRENSHLVNMTEMKSLFPFYAKKDKILIRRIINRQDRLDATFFNEEGVFKKDLNPFIIIEPEYDTKYILALINSKLFSWLYVNSSSIAGKDDFRQTTLSELRKLPIKKITKSNKSTVEKLIEFVTQLLNSKRHLSTIHSSNDKEYLERKCQTLDNQIDKLVYELYNITDEEIYIIEGS